MCIVLQLALFIECIHILSLGNVYIVSDVLPFQIRKKWISLCIHLCAHEQITSEMDFFNIIHRPLKIRLIDFKSYIWLLLYGPSMAHGPHILQPCFTGLHFAGSPCRLRFVTHFVTKWIELE